MKNTLTFVRAGLLALGLLLMGTVFLPSPATAHQGSLSAVAKCQPDGTYLVTYSLSWSSVPPGAFGTRILTREDTDGQLDAGWEDDPYAYQWTDRGAITTAQGSRQWTAVLPGDSLGDQKWVYAFLDWTNGRVYDRFHDTRVEDLGGNCGGPETVEVNAEFGDNVCIDNVYTEPTLDAPEVPGTTREVTGTVAPGQTVEVTYTALDGFVIEGQSTFTHTYPSEPSSVEDCETRPEQPEPVVRERSQVRTDCQGISERSWEIVREYVWDGEEWVLGDPVVRNDTGWQFVRELTASEREDLGCDEVAGEQETRGEEDEPTDVEVVPTQQDEPMAPSGTTVPTVPTAPTVPTSVDAGAGDSVLAPGGQRWLAPLLGGILVMGAGVFSRLKRLGEQA